MDFQNLNLQLLSPCAAGNSVNSDQETRFEFEHGRACVCTHGVHASTTSVEKFTSQRVGPVAHAEFGSMQLFVDVGTCRLSYTI